MLAHGQSVTDVSDAVGVSRQTIYTWLDDPSYQKMVDDEKSVILARMTGRLLSVCDQALQHLDAVTADEDETTSNRLRADSIALGRLASLLELADLDRRISRLEKSQDDRYKA
jgi:DNA-binding XRE family transcriptional regulator